MQNALVKVMRGTVNDCQKEDDYPRMGDPIYVPGEAM